MIPGTTSPDTKTLRLNTPLVLESGAVLPEVTVAYRTWGTLNAAGDNAVHVCHALTGWSDVEAWWGELLGEGRSLDPSRDFIVCSNVLGSCYGTTGPISPRPEGDGWWGPDFPAITIRDMVRVQWLLLEALGVRRLQLVVGGSMGGMQALEWALLYPSRVAAIAPIAISPRHSAWCIGLSEAQRQAIFADPLWKAGRYDAATPPASGLSVARMMAMCTYRSFPSFEERFSREVAVPGGYVVEQYLRHQGQKLVSRFDANTYITLTRAMDTHDVGRGRGGWQKALGAIHVPTLVISIDTDVLYTPAEQQQLAAYIPNARLATVHSPHGHDAFLIEDRAVNELLFRFRQETSAGGGQQDYVCAQ